MERQIQRGFIERMRTPDELDQKMLPLIIQDQLDEIKEEIDFLLKKAGEEARSAASWESDQGIEKLKKLKAASAALAKAVK